MNRSIIPLPLTRHVRGQALVELALTLSLLLLIVFGGVSALQVMGASYAVAQAVRAAAHEAALRADTAIITTWTPLETANGAAAAAARMVISGSPFVAGDQVAMLVTCEADCRRYDPITVRLRADIALWTPLPGWTRVTVEHAAVRLQEHDGP